MRVSEIFYSIQGEGMLAGVPSLFVRASGCNLRCGWCDTPYASWQPEGEEWTVEAILTEAARHPARHAVLTGGEPMLARELPELARRLKEAGHHITIETAGTLPPAGIVCDLASISPKLAGSTPEPERAGAAWARRHEQTRLNFDVLGAWADGYEVQWKFVIADQADLDEMCAVLAALERPVEPWRVLLMPEGTDPATLRSRQPLLVAACKEFGYRFSPRLHIELFGNTRGT